MPVRGLSRLWIMSSWRVGRGTNCLILVVVVGLGCCQPTFCEAKTIVTPSRARMLLFTWADLRLEASFLSFPTPSVEHCINSYSLRMFLPTSRPILAAERHVSHCKIFSIGRSLRDTLCTVDSTHIYSH